MSLISDAVSVGLGAWANTYASKKQDSYNRAAADKENERSKEAVDLAWERETAYNDPLAQMQRLKNAGLNPNLVYGTGSTGMTGNTHASVASVPRSIPREAVNYGKGALQGLTLESLNLNNDIARRTGKNLDIKNQQAEEILKSLKRENKVLEGSNMSKSDPFYARVGGRIASWAKDAYKNLTASKTGNVDVVVDDVYGSKN